MLFFLVSLNTKINEGSVAPLIEIKWADTGFAALEAETLVWVLIKDTCYQVVSPWKWGLAVGRGASTAVAPVVVHWCWLPGSLLLLMQFSLCCRLKSVSSLWAGSAMALQTLSLPRFPNPSPSLDIPSLKVSCFWKGLILLSPVILHVLIWPNRFVPVSSLLPKISTYSIWDLVDPQRSIDYTIY